MKALEISIIVFDATDTIDYNDYFYTGMKEEDLCRDVIMRLYAKHANRQLDPERFVWRVSKRMTLTDVII